MIRTLVAVPLLVSCIDPLEPELSASESELAVSARLCKYPGLGEPCRTFASDDLSLVADVWSDGSSMKTGVGSLSVAAGQRVTACERESFLPPCITSGGPAVLDLDAQLAQLWSIEVKPEAPDWYTHFDATNQDERGLGHVYPYHSEMGAIETNEIQGVAHDPIDRVWFFTSRGALHRVPVTADLDTAATPRVSRLYGTHWGDPDFSPTAVVGSTTGVLFVPNYDTASPQNAWVEKYDRNLNWLGWARFPERGSVGWVAINPLNGLLYAAHSVGFVDVYDPTPSDGSAMTKLYMIFIQPALIEASGKDYTWWDQVWSQGGAFDTNGELYLVADHSTEAQSSATGVYTLELHGRTATVVSFANIKYDPQTCWGCSRLWELEGLTIWNLDPIARHPSLQHKIHVLSLHTEPDDDDVDFHHIPARIPPRSVVSVFENANKAGRSDYFYLEELAPGVLYNLHAYNGYSLAIADRGSSMSWSSVAGNRCRLEFYEHSDGSGRKLSTGYTQGGVGDLTAFGFGDRMSSMRKVCY